MNVCDRPSEDRRPVETALGRLGDSEPAVEPDVVDAEERESSEFDPLSPAWW